MGFVDLADTAVVDVAGLVSGLVEEVIGIYEIRLSCRPLYVRNNSESFSHQALVLHTDVSTCILPCRARLRMLMSDLMTRLIQLTAVPACLQNLFQTILLHIPNLCYFIALTKSSLIPFKNAPRSRFSFNVSTHLSTASPSIFGRHSLTS